MQDVDENKWNGAFWIKFDLKVEGILDTCAGKFEKFLMDLLNFF